MQSSDQQPAYSEGGSESSDLSGSGTGSRLGRKQCAGEQLHSTLNTYKQQKLKKNIRADSQMMHFLKENLSLRKT